MNEGQRQLLESGLSLVQLAQLCGVSKGTVVNWRKGRTRPRDEHRAVLQVELGIGLDDWENVPGQDEPTPQPPEVRKVPPAGAAEPGAELPPTPYPEPPPFDASQIDHVKHSLRCVRLDLMQPGLSDTARSKFRNDEVRLSALYVRVREEEELRDPRFVLEHPDFVRFLELAAVALQEHPEASAALDGALAESLGYSKA